MAPPLVITADNADLARDAIRDILMMYVDMAESHGGFGVAVDLAIRFDPLAFVDAELRAEPQEDLGIDLTLLRAGAAIALLCCLYDEWCETDVITRRGGRRAFEAHAAGRLRHGPDVEAIVGAALERAARPLEGRWLPEAVVPIYERHVRGTAGPPPSRRAAISE